MVSLDDYRAMGKRLYDQLRLYTYPVAIKYVRSPSEVPEECVRPSNWGQKWSLCQAFTYARRWGRHTAMFNQDNFCVPSTAMHRWEEVTREEYVQSQLLQAWTSDQEAEEKIYDVMWEDPFSEDERKKILEYKGLVCSPLNNTVVVPDSVLIYGDGAQMTHIIQALRYEGKYVPCSSFQGAGESCYKGGLIPFATQKPQVILPGTGDRTLSGTTENELAVGLPGFLVEYISERMFKSGARLNMGQPVKTLLATGITEKLTPGFKYLREVLDGKKGSGDDSPSGGF